jgi:chromosome segregation ATPase
MNLDDLITDLKQQRDELRVQINLGSRELRDEIDEEWEEFQQKIKNFSAKAEIAETRDEISEELGELADDIKRGFDRLMKAVKD